MTSPSVFCRTVLPIRQTSPLLTPAPCSLGLFLRISNSTHPPYIPSLSVLYIMSTLKFVMFNMLTKLFEYSQKEYTYSENLSYETLIDTFFLCFKDLVNNDNVTIINIYYY